jgi:protein-disulfide isomerase
MGKTALFYLFTCCQFFLFSSFTKIGPEYQITYGKTTAPIHVVEYFSLSCPKCFEIYEADFAYFKTQYIDRDVITWTFHPDPADLLTLQLMVCLEKLPEKKRKLFFETFMDIYLDADQVHGKQILQLTMQAFEEPMFDLNDIEKLKTTSAYKASVQFLKQNDVLENVPTIEINGTIYDDYPNRKFIKEILQNTTLKSKYL